MAGEAGIRDRLAGAVRVQAAVPPEQEAVQQKRAATPSAESLRIRVEVALLEKVGQRMAVVGMAVVVLELLLLLAAEAMAGTGTKSMEEPETQTGEGAGTITLRAEREALLP